MRFTIWAEKQGATVRQLNGRSYRELTEQLRQDETLFGVHEGVESILPLEMQLALLLSGAEPAIAGPLNSERAYQSFYILGLAIEPQQSGYFAVPTAFVAQLTSANDDSGGTLV